ncbi:Proteasome, beta-type subunit, conserved site [Pelomyxa schiedti]|nr:Proteasome, beta-type subunit, conserved site [Pelomyxa schiedti]
MGDEEGHIMGYNGGSVLAMAGKNCVGIACDTRFGIRNTTVGTSFPKVFKMTDRCFIGMYGLVSDIQTVYKELRFKANLYKLKEEREMQPKVFSSVTANFLYSRRFGPYFVEPVICGLDADNKPFLSGLDLIGAPVFAPDFVASGGSVDSLFGMCESLWRPDMEPDDLFETLSQCLMAAVDRDAFSGWGGIVHIITPTSITSKFLRTRQD